MRKQIISAALAVALCCGVCVPTQAAGIPNAYRDLQKGTEGEAESYRRMVLNFNQDWRFQKGNPADAAKKTFDDSDWRHVNLPHDYSIENDFDPSSPAKSGGGYLDGGEAWYRKTWVVPAEYAGKRITVDFDGVYMNSDVYVNGQLAGHYPYGYSPFSYDITNLVVADGMTENVIAVYTNNQQPSSRWYSGSGIYRDVTLTVTDPVHLARYGTYVTTPKLETEYKAGKPATVHVESTIENESDADAEISMHQTVYYKGSLNEAGQTAPVAEVTTKPVTLKSHTTDTLTDTLSIPNPKLWQVGKGGLYTLETEVLKNGVIVDTYSTDFGLRWMDFSPNGFFINGEYTKLHGVCQHHDQGALGAVNNQTALDRQIQLLREMGVNAIRSAHNPASRALLNACNEQGIMLMDEAFDTWFGGKNDYDFHLFFDTPCTHPDAKPGQTWQEFDIKNMVNSAKNDPSVIMWSIGNEIGEAWGQKGRETGVQLGNWVREVDDSGRAVTMADPLFGPMDTWYYDPANKSDHWQIIDNNGTAGFNYGAYEDYDKAHELNPDWFVYSSETASAVSTRGAYFHPEVDSDPDAGRHRGSMQCSEFDNDHVNWGTTLHYALKKDAERKYLGGLFFWTGTDYTGEPAPFAGKNQAKSSYFGSIDTCGFPKDSFYLLQSQWRNVKTDPMVHILPHWNWENDNSILIDGKMPIRIYSNAPEVEVFLNGRSLGRKSFVQHPETETSLAYQTDEKGNLYLQWLVDYVPGTVEAVAYDATGKVIARDKKQTADEPAAIKMTPERNVILADGEDLAYIEVDVVDKNGVMNPNANNSIQFSISGNGRIVGTDNGNPLDWTNMKSTRRAAFNGKALVIVQSTNKSGSFTLTASSAGMPLSSVTVYTRDAEDNGSTLLGYDTVSAKTIAGKLPALPKTVTAHYADGHTEEKAVTWNTADLDLNKAGYITVKGQVAGTKDTVCANVEIVAVVGVRPISAVTRPGVMPKLPKTVQLVHSDGTEEDYAVTWDKIDPAKLTDEAIFVVNGTLDELPDCKAEAHVRVSTKVSHSKNWALAANGGTFAASHVSDYDPLEHINDGIISYNTNPKNGWGNWKYAPIPEVTTVDCTMDEARTVSSVVLHFREDDGIYVPSDTLIQYWDNTKQTWVDVENQSARNGFVGGEGSEITFNPVKTQKLRATFTRGEQDPNAGKKDCMVLTEFQVFGEIADMGSATADLSALTLDGKPLEGFDPERTEYTVELPYGAKIPTVAAQAADNATLLILPAVSNRSTASVQVTSEDGSTRKTYSIQFVEAPAGIAKAEIFLEKDALSEDDIAGIHVKATLQDGTVADEDLLDVRYSIEDAGVPAKAEVRSGTFYAYREGTVHVSAQIRYLDYAAVAANPLEVTIHAGKNKKNVVAYAPVRVTTTLGKAPVLPEVVRAQFDMGLSCDVKVDWDLVDPSQYGKYGSFVVNGTVEGQLLRPQATVTVRDWIAAQNQSMATPIGIMPTLPETVLLYASDGTTTYADVTWNDYDKTQLKQEGTIQISGTAAGLPVVLNLRVTKDTVQSENYAQLWTGFKYSMAFADYGQQAATVLNNGKRDDKWVSWGSPDGDTMKVGVIFGKDYPGQRYVDTIDLYMYNDTDLSRTGLKGCRVQYYNKPFQQDDTPSNPNNMWDTGMQSNPLNDDQNWTDVENLKLPESGFAIGKNTITFDMVPTTAIRLVLTKNGANGMDYYLSLSEIEAYGKSAVSQKDFTVTGITVDGNPLEGFAADKNSYVAPIVGTDVPKVSATLQAGDNASVTVLPASNLDGTTKIQITSEDGLKTETYTVAFQSEIPRYNVTVNNGKAYRAVKTLAADEVVEKYTEGEMVTVVADAAPAGKTFDHWQTEDLVLEEAQSGESIMTFTMPAKDVELTAVYKDRALNDAELVAAAKEKAGTGVAIPENTYADENAKAEAATKAVQALIGADVTAKVEYREDHYALTLERGKAGATVEPYEVTMVEAPSEEDKAAAEAVEVKIDAIGEVTLDSEAVIADARKAYDALTDTQKALVKNADKLTAAEAKLAELKETEADKGAAAAVETKIDAIGEVTLDSEAAIADARNAYDALTDTQKALVKNVEKLTVAENKLAELKAAAEADKAAATAVETKIDAIGEVTLDSEAAIADARKAYDALTDTQKALVKNAEKLTVAESKLAELKAAAEADKANKAAAEAVEAKIDAIGEVTLDSEAAIADARKAYDALTDTQKALVKNVEKLTAAEAKLAELKKPAPTEKPVPTEKPTPTEKPVEPTEKPVEPTAKPAAPTEAPVAPTAKPANGAQTGDSSNLMLWGLLGTLSLGGAAIVLAEKKKQSR